MCRAVSAAGAGKTELDPERVAESGLSRLGLYRGPFMHLGMIMECDYRPGGSQEDAFKQAFSLVQLAEDAGMSGVWLAERHFAPPKGHLDSSGTTNPSIASVPLVLASAIAARTERLRIGIAVAVLPLCHPIRMAEETATVDHISQGRLDFGVGRSSFTRSYEGYGVPYGESRERFPRILGCDNQGMDPRAVLPRRQIL